MQVNVEYRPAFALAKVGLDPGEAIVAEAGAMVAMSDGLELETKAILTCMKSEDWREGLLAFSEKRRPRFVGR